MILTTSFIFYSIITAGAITATSVGISAFANYPGVLDSVFNVVGGVFSSIGRIFKGSRGAPKQVNEPPKQVSGSFFSRLGILLGGAYAFVKYKTQALVLWAKECINGFLDDPVKLGALVLFIFSASALYLFVPLEKNRRIRTKNALIGFGLMAVCLFVLAFYSPDIEFLTA